MEGTVAGGPTKNFFVNMLTRDIALNDAILDLLDNCLDGVVRQKGKSGVIDADTFIDTAIDADTYYKGYHAKINISDNSFSIEDNCGGIPREIALYEAFRMGKENYSTNNLKTVGIYGIGMKRAIFKIGRNAEVLTKYSDDAYKVSITDDWFKKGDDDWSFPLNTESNSSLKEAGTKITITNINADIAFQWNSSAIRSFIDDLSKTIMTNYSFIIEKGFEIFINDSKIKPHSSTLLISDNSTGIKPFIFKKFYKDKNVYATLILGFHQPLPSDDDLDDLSTTKRTSADAGITVVCNDRVVLFNDKSHLTGWGETGIPQYHTQFIGIKGILVFESDCPQNLPMTTTKRGIDLSSSIYADMKNKMREALRQFTNYTNKWKGRKDEESKVSSLATSEPISKLIKSVKNEKIQQDYGLTGKNKDGGKIFKPNLPKPKNEGEKMKTISYIKSENEIKTLSIFFSDNDDSIEYSAKEVGIKSFEYCLKESLKSQGGSYNG